MRIDFKTSDTGSDSVSYKPQLRTDYRLGKKITFELEGGVEWDDQKADGTVAAQDTEIYYFSLLGYRWIF